MNKPFSPLVAAAVVSAALPALAQHQIVPVERFKTLPGLEVTVWAQSPEILNPTNMDVDKDGRIWVAEGVNYRRHYDRKPAGDRIVVLEDTNGDGRADKTWTFIQEEFLRAPMGVAVIDNQVVVSMAPDLIVYTDVNRDLKFDPAVDKREVLLHGFNGRVHDHTIHSVTVGPDGQWYWNAGNCGAMFTDKSGKTFRIGSAYDPYYGGKKAGDLGWSPLEIAGQKSDDGYVWLGGFAARMNPDGSGVYIIGHNFRNSYEQTLNAFGDVFQNDNDDPPASRTAFLLEYGNAGFCSFDGQRAWQADRRPGQDTPTSEWRQEDPGTMPAGDVYGGGAPTGIAFYEDGALGKEHRGLLLSCEPARNTVFGYYPKPDGAGFKLERFDFLTTNPEGEFAGADFKGGDRGVSRDQHTFFRPSDVVVGADGAIYVADFYDPRVGGHNDMDDSLSGAIYRIAPKGFKPMVPKTDFSTLDGALAAMKSPAVNVRGGALAAAKAHGGQAVKPATKLLQDENPAVQARAVWLLSQLGEQGVKEVEKQISSKDERMRTVAYRALRRFYETGQPDTDALVRLSKKLATDKSPAVRREVALAMRHVPTAQAAPVLVALAKGFDGQDRWYLEAIGSAAAGRESEVYDALNKEFGSADSLKWSPAFAKLAWRLHPPQAAAGLTARALANQLPVEDRKAAVVALAYIGNQETSNAILDIAGSTGPVKAEAMWWLLNRKDSAWKDHGINAELKKRGLYDPDNVQLASIVVPEPAPSKMPPAADILKLKGDVKRGEALATGCMMCHQFKGVGAQFGPDLTSFAQMQPGEVVVKAIIDPSADISHGFAGMEITTRDDVTIHGVVLSDGNPTIIASQGGVIQMVPRNQIKARKSLNRSLMLSAEQLGMGPQEVADILAYMKALK